MLRFKKSYVFWIIFFLVTLVFHSNHALDSDEGVILEGAWNIINGRQLYNDFFALVTPASYYLVAGLWRLIGISYWSANILAILALFFSAVGMYKVSRLIGGRYPYAPALFFILSSWAWPLISYHIFSLLTLIWAFYYFCRGLDSRARGPMLAAGFFSALTFWFLQTKGLVLIFALASYLLFFYLFKKQAAALRSLVYYLLASLFPLMPLFIFWPVQRLYQDLFVFPIFNYPGVINNSLYLWLGFVILWLLSLIFIARPTQSPKVYLLVYLQFLLLWLVLSLPDWFHLLLAVAPLYMLWPLAASKIASQPPPYPWFYFGSFLILAVVLATPSLGRVWTKPGRTVAGHQLLVQIARHCQADKYLYAGAFIPGVYFESRKLNVTLFSWLITGHHTPEQFQSARDALAAKNPECAVLSPLFVAKYRYNTDNVVDNYIRDNYQSVWSDANFTLYKLP